ncbi:saccharopine dehydrogenase NADP-binding domain-containing protein [Candidatus Pacearchaeota archaeon]|nr:saccharopine dehydrogenase NADP-binding domain-containing protein [Candidatus Pacearchaeota archaeon]
MKYDFIVFGGTGKEGRICARDLLESGYSVLLAGRDKSRVEDLLKNKKAGFLRVDLRDQNEIIKSIKLSNAGIAVNCAELSFNLDIMKACLKTRKHYTDLGGLHDMTIKQFQMDKEFKKAGIIAVTGCGATPGIANVLVSHGMKYFDKIEEINLGFAWDSNVKKFVVPYSIQSIFQEFTESPIILSNGKFRKSDRFKCVGSFNFPEIGKQTVYCIVHSEVYSFAKYYKSKGLKNVNYMAGFPAHSFNVIKTFLDLGFDSQDKTLDFNGIKVSPLEATHKILRLIKPVEGYEETEDIWVRMKGVKNRRKQEKNFDCLIHSLKNWPGVGSDVGTGMPISIISQMLKNNLITTSGVYAPEAIIPSEIFFKELAKRKIYVYDNGKRIN